MKSAQRTLATYREKRDFAETPEPSGVQAVPSGHRFVVQQHAARRMHYDFRLELDGVLLSWSVPKGPSLSPKHKRLAVRTEDHPLEYADFEGVIPKGQYGGGTVSVWDRGTWQPEGDAREAMKRGRLTFTLDGQKLHGTWHLVRTKPRGKQESWLLFKRRDAAASEDVDIVRSAPNSVLSARSLDAIAAAPERVWSSNRPADVAALVAQLPLGVALTNLDKVLYPEQGLTKGQLVAYLAVVADHMLPHVAGRPLMLLRCPEGRGGSCFFQKKRSAGTPDVVGSVEVVESSGERADYMQIHDLAGLVALAQLGTLEIHTWGCHAAALERPDLLVFDLDPDPTVAWDRVAAGALELRGRLGELGLDSWVKTTGGKGLHVVVPVTPRASWDQHKAFAKRVVDELAAAQPARYTATMTKASRKGRIYLDYLRNGRGATFVAPYSPRARPGAPVSVPIAWDELARGVDPRAFTIESVPRRLGELTRDPWAGLVDARQRLPGANARRG
ncbi:MAG TPA: non-homologous end-joining DNA ligase [Kofleriaceae bacterium]|nr:non-homologous end-joining DNA ligase [Kofleriaceae bacterium]